MVENDLSDSAMVTQAGHKKSEVRQSLDVVLVHELVVLLVAPAVLLRQVVDLGQLHLV